MFSLAKSSNTQNCCTDYWLWQTCLRLAEWQIFKVLSSDTLTIRHIIIQFVLIFYTIQRVYLSKDYDAFWI